MVRASWYSFGISSACANENVSAKIIAEQNFVFRDSFPNATGSSRKKTPVALTRCSFDGLHVDDLNAAFLDERAGHRDRLRHFLYQHLFAGLMVLDAHGDIQ